MLCLMGVWIKEGIKPLNCDHSEYGWNMIHELDQTRKIIKYTKPLLVDLLSFLLVMSVMFH